MAKRLKTVFPTSEVAHIWANQSQSEARNAGGNFYFKGPTIYSYGSHFPIATIIEDGTVLFTTRSYSNTTAKHIIKARQACSHKRIIYVIDVPTVWTDAATKKNCNQISTNSNNISHWLRIIEVAISELNNPKNRNIAGRVETINNEIAEMNAFLNYFGEAAILKTLSPDLKKRYRSVLKLVASSQSHWADRIEAAKQKEANRVGLTEEQREANRVKREEKMKKDYDLYFQLWQSYDDEGLRNLPESVKMNVASYTSNGNRYRRSTYGMYGSFTDRDGFTRLRYNAEKKRVETSKGIEIPVEIAKRTWLKIKDCTDCKGLNIDVVGYKLTAANDKVIVAGCHTIPQSDVQYIAQLLNWN